MKTMNPKSTAFVLVAIACSGTASGQECLDFDLPPIYVSIVTHNEEPLSGLYPDFVADETAFWEHRTKVVEFACMLAEEGVQYNYQSDWNFLMAAAMYDTGTVSTNDRNFLHFLSEDLDFGIDPHAHESSYNYADVAYLIESLGVVPSSIVGGFLCHPPVSSKVEYLRDTLHGWNFEYDWKAEVLWGGATMKHQNEDSMWISGIWKPQDNFHYLSHDEQAPLPCIGGFRPNWEGLDSLLSLQAAGELTEGNIYTQTIMITQINLAAFPGAIEEYRQKILEYDPYVAAGLLQWVQLDEVIDIWHSEYVSQPNLYSWLEGDIGPGTGIAFDLQRTALHVWPNPACDMVNVSLPENMIDSGLSIYDISGRLVRSLPSLESGIFTWNGRDDSGREAPPGLYLARLEAGVDSRCTCFIWMAHQ